MTGVFTNPPRGVAQTTTDAAPGEREGATVFRPTNKYSPLKLSPTAGYANGEPDDGTAATHDASAGAIPSYTTAKKGQIAVVTVAGTLGGVSVAKGDLLHALQDNPTTAAHWAIIGDSTAEWEAAVEAAQGGEIWLYGTFLCVDANPEDRAKVRGEYCWLQRCQKTFMFQYNQTSPGTADNLAYFNTNGVISTLSAVAMAAANDPYTGGTMNRVTRLTLTTAAEAANFNVGDIIEVTCDTQTPSTAGGSGSFVAAPAKIQYIDTVSGYLYLDHKIGWHATIAAATNKCVVTCPTGRAWDIEGLTIQGAPTIIGESIGWWKTLFGDEVSATISGSSGSTRTITRAGHNMLNGQYVRVGATSGTEDTSCVVSNATASTFDITVPAKRDLDSGGAASVATSGTIYYQPVFNTSEVNTNHHGAHLVFYHCHGNRIEYKHTRLWAKGVTNKHSNYTITKREGVGAHSINPMTRFDNNITTGRLLYDMEAWNSGKGVYRGDGVSDRHGYTGNMTGTSTSYTATRAWIGRYAGACVYNVVDEEITSGVSNTDSHSDEYGLEVRSRCLNPVMHPFAESYYAGTHNIRGMNEKRTERGRGGYKALVLESVEREAGNWVDIDIDYSDAPYTSTSQVAFEAKSHSTRTNPPTVYGNIKLRNYGIGSKFANSVITRLNKYEYGDVAKYGIYLVGDTDFEAKNFSLDFTQNTEGQTTRSAVVMDNTARFSASIATITMGATYNPTAIFTDNDNVSGKSVTVGVLIIRDPSLVGMPAIVTAGRESNFTTLEIGRIIYNGVDVTAPLVNTTAVGNVGAGTDTLITRNIAANTLLEVGAGIEILAWGTTANNANAKTLALLFGSTTLNTVTLITSQAATWSLKAVVVSTGTNTQDWWTSMQEVGTTAQIGENKGTATETATSAITVKCTGIGTGDNDIVQEGMLIKPFKGVAG